MTGVLIRRGERHAQESDMWQHRQRLDVAESQGPPLMGIHHQKLGRYKEGFYSASPGSMALPTPWFQTFSLQNSEMINSIALSHLERGILLQLPQDTNPPGYTFSLCTWSCSQFKTLAWLSPAPLTLLNVLNLTNKISILY